MRRLRLIFEQPIDFVRTQLPVAIERPYERPPVHSLAGNVAGFVARWNLVNSGNDEIGAAVFQDVNVGTHRRSKLIRACQRKSVGDTISFESLWGLNPFFSDSPSTITPPDPFANAEMVSAMVDGIFPTDSFTSTD